MKKGGRQVCGSASCAAIIPAADAQLCARCKLVSYCGRSCQKADWKTHKPRCNAEAEACDAQSQRKSAGITRLRNDGSGAGAGASASDDTGKEDGEEEEECAICLEALVDPLAPCAEQPSHRYCRGCVQEMQRQKLPSCPLCRGKLQDAEELFYESVQLAIRAKKAHTKAQRDALHAKQHSMLHRMLRVDPSFTSAQYNLAIRYYDGKGVKQDFKQAVAWYRKAAEQGMAHAQYNLGNIYRKGEGVQQDFKQAAAWYQKVADQGDASAQNCLGRMYHNGQGVQQDFKQAAAWCRKAAEQGYASAQFNLGVMYEKGEGVQQDSKQAAAWLQKAADQGHTKADVGLGDLSEMAGDYQAAFASYRAGQAADRDQARAGMRRCLEHMAESREQEGTK
jgi:TPR repeat protein